MLSLLPQTNSRSTFTYILSHITWILVNKDLNFELYSREHRVLVLVHKQFAVIDLQK